MLNFIFEFQLTPFIHEGLGQNTVFSGVQMSAQTDFFWVTFSQKEFDTKFQFFCNSFSMKKKNI